MTKDIVTGFALARLNQEPVWVGVHGTEESAWHFAWMQLSATDSGETPPIFRESYKIDGYNMYPVKITRQNIEEVTE